ncbi:MAG: hypothetical protein ACYCRH_10255 [Acidiferrobacteraceae bacterium]
MQRYHSMKMMVSLGHRRGHWFTNGRGIRSRGGIGLTVLALMIAAWSTPGYATTDPDLAYVENYIQSPPTMYSYGSWAASSVSPCFGSSCQSSNGNPFQNPSSVSSFVGGIGSASADADLSTGVLRAYAQEDGTTGSSAAAGAVFWDTLTFSGVTGTNTTGTLVFNVPGTFTDVGYGGACAAVQVGGYAQCNPFTAPVLNASSPSETIKVPFTLSNGSATEIVAALYGTAYNSFNIATADLKDPPQVSLLLPTGVTYTSASGVFLSSTTPVPEPATWVTMACGLALLWFTASRGRNARTKRRAS